MNLFTDKITRYPLQDYQRWVWGARGDGEGFDVTVEMIGRGGLRFGCGAFVDSSEKFGANKTFARAYTIKTTIP